MADDVFPDPETPFGERVRTRLRDDIVVWLTTIGADGTPQPNPVWFIDEGETILVYNRPNANRLTHIRTRPRVALSFDSDGHGGDIVVLTGRAEIVSDQPPAHEIPAYVDKYGVAAAGISGSVEAFAVDYSVALRISVERVRGF